MLHSQTIESGTLSLLKDSMELHAITYFADADESETPVSYKVQTWDIVKNGIKKKVSD